MSIVFDFLKKLVRAILLLVIVALGTILLTRFAPGYFTDAREMDARYVHTVQVQLQDEQTQQATLLQLTTATFRGWFHGDLGRSRQYAVPVAELVRPRLAITLALLGRGLLFGWLLATSAAMFACFVRSSSILLHLSFTVLVVIPTSAIATLCLLTDTGGPVWVLTLLISGRDFKFLSRALRSTLREAHFLHTRAQGIRLYRMVRVHLLPAMLPQFVTLANLSIVTALSAIVPVEVIFDVPGIGQLAWNAAMNRDLPVLMAVTLMMASVVAAISILSPPSDRRSSPVMAPA